MQRFFVRTMFNCTLPIMRIDVKFQKIDFLIVQLNINVLDRHKFAHYNDAVTL